MGLAVVPFVMFLVPVLGVMSLVTFVSTAFAEVFVVRAVVPEMSEMSEES